MRLNKMSDTTKIIIFAATIVVICVLCAIGFKVTNEGKSAVTSGSRKFNEMASYQDSSELSVYDGSTILGNELVNIIKRAIDDNRYYAVYVRTRTSAISYNYEYDPINNVIKGDGTKVVPKRPGDHGYINPDAQFYCTIKKDDDDIVICMDFELIN